MEPVSSYLSGQKICFRSDSVSAFQWVHVCEGIWSILPLCLCLRWDRICFPNEAMWVDSMYSHRKPMCARKQKPFLLVNLFSRRKCDQGRINHSEGPYQRKAGGPFPHTRTQDFLCRGCTFLLPKSWRSFSPSSLRLSLPTLHVQTSTQRDRNFGSWSGAPGGGEPLPWYNRHNG